MTERWQKLEWHCFVLSVYSHALLFRFTIPPTGKWVDVTVERTTTRQISESDCCSDFERSYRGIHSNLSSVKRTSLSLPWLSAHATSIIVPGNHRLYVSRSLRHVSRAGDDDSRFSNSVLSFSLLYLFILSLSLSTLFISSSSASLTFPLCPLLAHPRTLTHTHTHMLWQSQLWLFVVVAVCRCYLYC